MRYSLVATLVISSLVICPPAKGQGPSLFRVNQRSYNLSDLTGMSETELSKYFEGILADLTDKELARFVSPAEATEMATLPANAQRSFLKKALWKHATQRLIRDSLPIVVLASMADEITKEHGIDPELYFDFSVIRNSVRRQIRFIELLYTAPKEKEKDLVLYEKFLKSVGVPQKKETWLKAREKVRGFDPISMFPPLFCRSPIYEEIAVKAALTRPLLIQCCSEGCYFQKGWDLAERDLSTFICYEIKEYTGERETLDRYFAKISKNGFILEKGMEALVKSLRNDQTMLKFDVRLVNGPEMIAKNLPIGSLVEMSPNTYAIYGWQRRFDRETIKKEKGLSFKIREHALAIAANDYFPDVALYYTKGAFGPKQMDGHLGLDGIVWVANEMHRGNYIKKPYPADSFEHFLEARSKRQTFAVRKAAISIARDQKEAEKLVLEILAESERNTLPVIQERFRTMALAIAQDFKIVVPTKEKK